MVRASALEAHLRGHAGRGVQARARGWPPRIPPRCPRRGRWWCCRALRDHRPGRGPLRECGS
eukprot:3900412-Pyramimonas_sp.AAC.1